MSIPAVVWILEFIVYFIKVTFLVLTSTLGYRSMEKFVGQIWQLYLNINII